MQYEMMLEYLRCNEKEDIAMRELDRAGLDNWITGHYGQDQFSKYDPDEREEEEQEEESTDPMDDEPFEKEENV